VEHEAREEAAPAEALASHDAGVEERDAGEVVACLAIVVASSMAPCPMRRPP